MSFLFDFTLDIVIWGVKLTKYINIVGNAGELRWKTAATVWCPKVADGATRKCRTGHGRERGNWRAPWARLHLSFSESHHQPIPGRN